MLQVVVNSLITGGILAFGAVGLTSTYGVMKFTNMAHGSFITLAAYFTYLFSVTLGINLAVSILLSAVVVGLLAVFFEHIVFKKVRGGGIFGGLTPIVASLGILFILDNLVLVVWGARPLSLEYYPGLIITPAVRISYIQLSIIVISILSMLAFHILLTRTKLGKAMRAVSDNPDLARCSGINSQTVINSTWFVALFYSAIGGSLTALDTQIWPLLGFAVLLDIFAAVTVGGIGNPYGAMLGALLIGFAQNFGISVNWGAILTFGTIDFYINPNYKAAISFVVISLVLLLRPSGILKGIRRR